VARPARDARVRAGGRCGLASVNTEGLVRLSLVTAREGPDHRSDVAVADRDQEHQVLPLGGVVHHASHQQQRQAVAHQLVAAVLAVGGVQGTHHRHDQEDRPERPGVVAPGDPLRESGQQATKPCGHPHRCQNSNVHACFLLLQ
jgi:hypothetical protein